MTKRYIDFAPKTSDVQVARTKMPMRRRVLSARSTNAAQVTRVSKPSNTSRVVRATESVGAPRVIISKTHRSTVGAAGVVRTRKVVAATTITPRPKVIRRMGNSTSRVQNAVKLGEIEDVKFVNTNVPKRALGDGTDRRRIVSTVSNALENGATLRNSANVVSNTAADAKAKIIGNRAKVRKASVNVASGKAVANGINKTKATTSKYVIQGSPFINQDKVAKRPLSKNVYQKRVGNLEETGRIDNMTNSKDKAVTIISKPKKDSKVGVVVAIILTIILGAVAGTVAFLLLPK